MPIECITLYIRCSATLEINKQINHRINKLPLISQAITFSIALYYIQASKCTQNVGKRLLKSYFKYYRNYNLKIYCFRINGCLVSHYSSKC